MLTVEIRNLYNPKYDFVSGAGLYLNPSTQVYPIPGSPPKPDAVSSGGVAKLDIGKLEPGEHTLWIVPKNASADPVGVQTAAGINTDRIYRGLRIQLSTGVAGRGMTGAAVHSSTFENGAIVADVKSQHLAVQLRAVWMQSGKSWPRGGKPIDMIVVHKTGGNDLSTAVQTLLDGRAGNAHYLNSRDGHLIKFVLESLASGHAAPEAPDQYGGAYSHWGTQAALAFRSIGIENVGADDVGFTDAQYRSLIRLIKELMDKYKIPRHRVIGHSDVLTDGNGHLSSRREACPGWQFDWPRMEKEGIGLRRDGGAVSGTDPVAAFFAAMQKAGTPDIEFVEGDYDTRQDGKQTRPGHLGGQDRPGLTDKPIAQLQTWLAEIGYSVGKAEGLFNPRTARAVLHFQVHFMNQAANAAARINRQTADLIRAVRAANPRAD